MVDRELQGRKVSKGRHQGVYIIVDKEGNRKKVLFGSK